MRLLIALVVLLLTAPAARAATPVRIAPIGSEFFSQLASDAQQRVYSVTRSGQVTVYTPSGRELARWSAGGPIAVSPAGDVFTSAAGTVTRRTWDGRPVATLPASGRPVVDPRGSLILERYDVRGFEYSRFGFDGTPLGSVPVGLAHVVGPDGVIWAWGGALFAYRGDGALLAQIGYDCSMVRDCRTPGPYGNPSNPLLTFGADGTLYAAEAGRIQVFDPQGRLLYACDDPLGSEWISGITVVGDRLILAGTKGLYRTGLRPGTCIDAPIRIERVSLVHGARRDVIRVRVTGPIRFGATLISDGRPPLSGQLPGVSRTLRSGVHDLTIPGCRRIRTCLGAPPYRIMASGRRESFYASIRHVSAR